MTTYQEVFAPFYGTDPFDQIQKNIECNRFLRDCAETILAIRMLMIAWDYESGGSNYTHPDGFIALCKRHGFPEWPDLERFGLAVQGTTWEPQAFVDSIDVPWPDGINIEWKAVTYIWQGIVATGFPIDKMNGIDIGEDIEYGLVSDADLMRLIETSPSDRYKYIPERRNCNDFARRLFQGWLAVKGYGNLAIGWLMADFTKDNGEKTGHMVCWALTKENNIWVFEPQSDAIIWRFGDPFKWLGMTAIEPVKMGI